MIGGGQTSLLGMPAPISSSESGSTSATAGGIKPAGARAGAGSELRPEGGVSTGRDATGVSAGRAPVVAVSRGRAAGGLVGAALGSKASSDPRRGASAGGGTNGRRPDELLRACVGARVIAAARVARSDASGSADSGSTITDGSRGRLATRRAGTVIETSGFWIFLGLCSVDGCGVDGESRLLAGPAFPAASACPFA